MRRHFIIFPTLAVLLISLAGCIHNDIPYARVPQLILSIAAEGELQPAVIDDENFSATVYLEETTDIYHVRFSDFTYTDGAVSSDNLLDGTYDLSRPFQLVLEKHYPYTWTINAVQEIERRFAVEGQLGSATVDVPGHRIILKVPSSVNSRSMAVTDIKLGPEDQTVLSPAIAPGDSIDLSKPFEIKVTYWGRTWIWTVYAEKTDLMVNTSQVDAWSKVIWAYGEAVEGEPHGFQYRVHGSENWTQVDDSDVQTEGATFRACIKHLQPLTEYDVRAWSGELYGNTVTVTTQSTLDIPDGDFDQWWLNGRIWCPWSQDGLQFWDTGNTGATTLGDSNVTPSDHTPDGTGKAASLLSKFVGIGSLGKLAAGSIYSGVYARTDGTNGILNFGRQWNLRPTKLKGYFQYSAKNIDRYDTKHKYLEGRPDSCHIYVALADWSAPYEVRTNPRNQQLFDPSLPSIIAYGELVFSGNMDGYRPFEIELKYRSTSRVPTYVQITCAASKYGDFFTGGDGSLLYVDQLYFDYDY